ncbi:MAG: hypothetical protein JW776_03345 [Candidatus Lokiarchaeota archaeon]|nr:hypothetical protein [Candidatus Lokiarchaeota archaeon]
MNVSTPPPSVAIWIIQGENSKKIISQFPSSVNWINWTDKKIVKNHEIYGKNFLSLIKNLTEHQILNNPLHYEMNHIFEGIHQTQSIIQKLPLFLEHLRNYDLFFEFIRIYNRRIDLEQELRWAKVLESKSKASVEMKRISKLNEEITDLEKSKARIEPRYEFLKKILEEHQTTLNMLKEEIQKITSIYITKTRKINKLKRFIDNEKTKSDIYRDKIEELTTKFSVEEQEDNQDYKRLLNKQKTVDSNIEKKNKIIQDLSREIQASKSLLKQKKDDLTKIKRKYENSYSKYTEVNQSYTDIIKNLKEKKKERDIITHHQTEEISPSNGKIAPSNIRFSSLIENDLKENSIQLMKFINLEETTPKKYYDQVLEDLKYPTSHVKDLTIPIIPISENILKEIHNLWIAIEKSLNSLLAFIKVQIILSQFPIYFDAKEINPNYGISFDILKNDKPIVLDKLPTEEKLYFMWSFEFVLNELAGMKVHLYSDENYQFKRSKKLLERIIQLVQKGIVTQHKSIKIVILLSKPVLEAKNQKDIVITTI